MTKLMIAAMTASVTMKYQNAVTTRSSPRSGRCGTIAPGTARVSMSWSLASSAPPPAAGRECMRAGGGRLASPVYHTPRFRRRSLTTSRTFEAMAGGLRILSPAEPPPYHRPWARAAGTHGPGKWTEGDGYCRVGCRSGAHRRRRQRRGGAAGLATLRDPAHLQRRRRRGHWARGARGWRRAGGGGAADQPGWQATCASQRGARLRGAVAARAAGTARLRRRDTLDGAGGRAVAGNRRAPGADAQADRRRRGR